MFILGADLKKEKNTGKYHIIMLKTITLKLLHAVVKLSEMNAFVYCYIVRYTTVAVI